MYFVYLIVFYCSIPFFPSLIKDPVSLSLNFALSHVLLDSAQLLNI